MQDFKDNWRAGLGVAVVSVALLLSLAVASNVTPATGMITAAWSGLVTALAGKNNFSLVRAAV